MSRRESRTRPPARSGNALLVDDVMARRLVAVGHNATLATAWRLMRSDRVRHQEFEGVGPTTARIFLRDLSPHAPRCAR